MSLGCFSRFRSFPGISFRDADTFYIFWSVVPFYAQSCVIRYCNVYPKSPSQSLSNPPISVRFGMKLWLPHVGISDKISVSYLVKCLFYFLTNMSPFSEIFCVCRVQSTVMISSDF